MEDISRKRSSSSLSIVSSAIVTELKVEEQKRIEARRKSSRESKRRCRERKQVLQRAASLLLENHIAERAAVLEEAPVVLEEAPVVLEEAPAVATMLQIEYRRMKSELEVERKKNIDALEITKRYIQVMEELKSKHIVVVEEITKNCIEVVKDIKSEHIVVVEKITKNHNAEMKETKSNHNAEMKETKLNHNAQMKDQMKVVRSIIHGSDKPPICISTNNSDNSKSRPKKVGINEDTMNELKGIMETITTMQKKCLMDAGAKKEDVDVLVKSSFYVVGKGPWTTIMHSSYKTLGEIHSTETNNICMQTCHQNLKGESYIMLDQWQMANESIGTGMGEKNSLIKAFGQSGADQIGMLEKFLLLVKDKVNIVSMGQCALSGNLGALSDVHVSHTQNLVTPASGYHHLFALDSWVELVQLLRDVDEREAFIHVTSSVYKALVLCSSSTKKTFDSQELYEAQVLALVSARPALRKCRDTNTRTWTQFRP